MRQSGHFEPFLQKDVTRIKVTKGTKMQPSKYMKGIKKHINVNKHISNFFPMVFKRIKTLPFLFLFAYLRFCAF